MRVLSVGWVTGRRERARATTGHGRNGVRQFLNSYFGSENNRSPERDSSDLS